MFFILNAANKNNLSDGEAYYQNVWFRNEAMSDDWMEIDGLQMDYENPLYTVTEGLPS